MFHKLVKHEFKATGRIILFLYLAAAVLSGVSLLLQKVANAIPLVSVAISLFSIILMIACPLVTYVIVILRFYRSCYGDEGYLTQTLPVSGKQIYFSKLLVAFCWCLLSILLVFLLLFSLMSLLTGVAGGSDISLMHVFVEVFGKLPLATSTKIWFIAMMIVYILFSCANWLVQIYFCICAGNLRVFRSLGSAAPVLIYIMVYIAMQILMLAAMFLFPYGITLYGGHFHIIREMGLQSMLQGADPTSLSLGVFILSPIAFAVMMYFGVRWLSRKVNLK
jgi:hypothetical protein